jgi:hypothetical protein
MLEPLLERAKHALTSSVETLIGRGVVAVPFLIALGFATSALTIKLIEMWGAALGCLAIALLYFAASLLAAAFFLGRESRKEEEYAAAQKETEQPFSIASLLQTDPLALLSANGTAVSVLRLLGRNTPLLLTVLVVGIHLWARSEATSKAVQGAP